MFEDFIPSGFHFDLLNQPSLILFLLLLIISISFLSGIYPAFILSNFKPVLVLKNQISTGSVQTRNAWIRSEEHTSELQSLMRISYAVFCLKKKNKYIISAYAPILTST